MSIRLSFAQDRHREGTAMRSHSITAAKVLIALLGTLLAAAPVLAKITWTG